MKPGVYDLPEAAYHADPAPQPSLSSGIAKVLLSRSPRHAWMQHPRLNPAYREERDTKFDIGKAAHALLLQGEVAVEHIDAEDYRTKAAQQARDAAYAAGKIPLLPAQWHDVKAMVAAARAQLAAHKEAADAFTNGKPEQTLIWQEGGIWCRARLDWLPNGGVTFYDYKTTSSSANPDVWTRTAYDGEHDLQVALYRRGIRAVLGIAEPRFRFVVQETEPPYALSVIELSPAAIDYADKRIREAIEIWRRCLETDTWPGYPAHIAYIDPPAWHEQRWAGRELRAEFAREAGEDLLTIALNWQAPLEHRP